MDQEVNAFDQNAVTARRTTSTIRQVLWALTGALGLAAWAVGLTGPVLPGFAVSLAVLAGAVAAIGLLPGQAVRGWFVVAVAVTAFTATMTTTVTAGGAGWVLIVVDVLVALQMVLAASALLLEPRVSPATQSASETDYAAYAEYVQAYRDYAQQYESGWPEQYSAAGTADAASDGRGTALDDGDAWADLQSTYARHVSPAAQTPSERTARRAAGHSADAGMPGVDRVERPHHAGGQVSPGSAPMSPGAH